MIEPWTWQTSMDPGREYLVMASSLPAARHRSTGALFRGARATKRQLRGAEGLVGFALMARPLRKQYGTLSIWTGEDALHEFARSEPHARLMRELRPHMGQTIFITWTVSGDDGRPTWREAFERLEAAAV